MMSGSAAPDAFGTAGGLAMAAAHGVEEQIIQRQTRHRSVTVLRGDEASTRSVEY